MVVTRTKGDHENAKTRKRSFGSSSWLR